MPKRCSRRPAYGDVYLFDGTWTADSDQQSNVGNTHWYTGRERDPETGLQLNRHRFYASHLGRWVTRDPIEYAAGSHNLYDYVANQSTNATDPFGLSPCLPTCTGRTDFFECMEECGERVGENPNYGLVGGPNNVTVAATNSGNKGSGKKFGRVPPGIRGPIYPKVDDLGELATTLGDHQKSCPHPCINTLIIACHGNRQGKCDFNVNPEKEEVFPGDCS